MKLKYPLVEIPMILGVLSFALTLPAAYYFQTPVMGFLAIFFIAIMVLAMILDK